jgi:uncharacterized protein involved in exopolysaccharide biosynthesis
MPYSSALRRYWWLPVLTVLVAFATAAAVLYLGPTTYESTATLLVRTPAGDPNSPRTDALLYADRLANTYRVLVKREDVRDAVADAAGVEERPKLSVSIPANSELLEATVESSDAEAAQRGADELADVLVEKVNELQREPRLRVAEALMSELQELNARIARNTERLAQTTDTATRSALEARIRVDQESVPAFAGQLAQARTAVVDVGIATVLLPPEVPDSPARPSWVLAFGSALIGGLVAGVALALLFNRGNVRRGAAIPS